MSPREYIADLCRRYGVSARFGQRLLPLAEQADAVDPEMRRRLHEFLERSFLAQVEVEADEAAAQRSGEARGAPAPEELKALDAVATVLHDWEPPRWLRRWAEGRGVGQGDDEPEE